VLRVPAQIDQTFSIKPQREIAASLLFRRGAGRTTLGPQFVPYPFHVTRPFYLDRERPDLATLYLQSASGGLYRGDRIALSIEAAPHAAVHVTTQASTIVHRAGPPGVVHETNILIGEHALVAMTPDPLVLFPAAEISCAMEVVLPASGHAILTDGFTHHDPVGAGRPFDRYSNALTVRDDTGVVLLSDRGTLQGEFMFGSASPLGPYLAAGTLMVLGDGAQRCDINILEESLAAMGCLAGMSLLPNGVGVGGRILAPDGGALARALEAAFAFAFQALVGTPPARRRK
jgi:urease accessory protein